MAYKIIRRLRNLHQPGDEIVAVLDDRIDLEALGKDYAPGSVAIVAAEGAPCYMLNASGVWMEL